jgi:hypothetical protein
LLDYTLDPGQTATAFICFEVNRDLTVADGTRVETPAPDVPYETPLTFTLTEPFEAYRDLNRLEPYDFSHPSLLIPRGTTHLAVTGHPAGLKSGRAVFVRLADAAGDYRYHRVTLTADPIYKTATDGTDITLLQWAPSEALPWDAALAATALLGNAAEFFHGTLEPAGTPPAWYVDQDLADYELAKGPLGYRNGQPLISIRVDGEMWQRVRSLRTSQPFDPHYQIVDLEDGKNRVIFGDNLNGRRPPRYALIEMSYLAGLGRAGNASAGTLTRLPDEVKGILSVFNPLPASGGRDPETEAHGKLWGPKTIRRQKRAVTETDYEREAMAVDGVSRANARFIWTGSWVTVRVTLDPQGEESLSADLAQEVYEYLMTRKMAGYDIQIRPARYVPLDIAIRFCLEDLAFRDQVLRDLKSALGNGTGADGTPGFFHPDQWTFGQSVTLSGLYAAIARVNGVACAEVLTFKRLLRPQGQELSDGLIALQWDEIARLEDDRNFPEHGQLELELVGGR